MIMTHRMYALVCVLLLSIFLAAPALAYIDPGTGSFVVQGIIAAVVGAGVAVKLFWHRIKSALTGSRADDLDDDE